MWGVFLFILLIFSKCKFFFFVSFLYSLLLVYVMAPIEFHIYISNVYICIFIFRYIPYTKSYLQANELLGRLQRFVVIFIS